LPRWETQVYSCRYERVYLASPLADYVSGAVLRVDGGTIRSVN
jgi:NAD(P)-dependent dehydrogenase (short-subunit alcohol dehydrogenase family)